ncbi:hypothetical protein JOB18_029880 [Solea senegalensis]|uniref:Uncharacterized protein n=1 Tax=Solea senegalensis TaxID=28829 RepID=A0AAV6RN05_SOLSE|nr:hypothetical protein JOB18_029880 [Solea senegalensis]
MAITLTLSRNVPGVFFMTMDSQRSCTLLSLEADVDNQLQQGTWGLNGDIIIDTSSYTRRPPTHFFRKALLFPPHQSISEGGVCSAGRGPRLPAGVCGARTHRSYVKAERKRQDRNGNDSILPSK